MGINLSLKWLLLAILLSPTWDVFGKSISSSVDLADDEPSHVVITVFGDGSPMSERMISGPKIWKGFMNKTVGNWKPFTKKVTHVDLEKSEDVELSRSGVHPAAELKKRGKRASKDWDKIKKDAKKEIKKAMKGAKKFKEYAKKNLAESGQSRCNAATTLIALFLVITVGINFI